MGRALAAAALVDQVGEPLFLGRPLHDWRARELAIFQDHGRTEFVKVGLACPLDVDFTGGDRSSGTALKNDDRLISLDGRGLLSDQLRPVLEDNRVGGQRSAEDDP